MVDPLFGAAIWQVTWLGNTLYDYLVALGIFVGFVVVAKYIQWLLLKALERATAKTETEFDDALVTVARTIKPPFYTFLAFYVALRYLNVEGLLEQVVNVILISWLVYQVVVALQILIDFYVERRVARTADKGAQAAIQLIHSLSSIILWAIAILFVLSNLGVNVNSLIAGLGIGGIAVALAAQSVLADLFSSLSIYLDKPFVPGDFIEVGDNKGTVEKIGIKTTRIKATSGEELVISNQEITSGLVRNYRKMKERRVAFTIGVTYDTTHAKLKLIPGLVQRIIEKQDKTRFDRVHFEEMGDSALIYAIVYFVNNKSYEVHMDIQQEILLGIKEAFEEEKIDIAFPTRTVHLHQA